MSTKTWVIKLGGAVLNTENAAKALFDVLSADQNNQFVIVHGGGSLVDTWLKQAGFASAKHQGLRISLSEQMPYIVGALAGCANKQLVSQALEPPKWFPSERAINEYIQFSMMVSKAATAPGLRLHATPHNAHR